MDGSSRTINPACLWSLRAQASKGLGKTSSWVQTLLQDAAFREPRHALPWMAAGKANAEEQMLVEANSKPHDIVIYTDGSVTRDQSGWGFMVKQGGRTVQEDSGVHRVTTSSLSTEVEAVTYAIQWLASQLTHRLCMPSFSQTQWTSCKRWSLEWAALTGTQPCTVFCYKDFCGSTVLGMPESVGMKGQINWQAQQISHLEELSEHGQVRASQHWSTEGKQSGERKRSTFHPPRSRTICVLPGKYWHSFEGNLGDTAERQSRARMGLSECYDAILSWNWNWNNSWLH